MAQFELRFPIRDIGHWAGRYEYDETPILPIVSDVKERGFLTKKDFLTACRWKTARSQSRCRENSSEFICEVTKCALGTSTEQLRIEVLTLLNGVSWPTASVILHFFHSDPYPIMDVRALWSLTTAVPARYEYRFWRDYTAFCRRLSKRCGISMRTLDRALWQYSKERQK
jgi:hypothetical protein